MEILLATLTVVGLAIGVLIAVFSIIFGFRFLYFRSKYRPNKVGPALEGLMPALPKGYFWSLRQVEDGYDGPMVRLRLWESRFPEDPDMKDSITVRLKTERHGAWREPAEISRLLLNGATRMAGEIEATQNAKDRQKKLSSLFTC